MWRLGLFLAYLAVARLRDANALLPASEMRPIEIVEARDCHMHVFKTKDEYEIHLEPGYSIKGNLATIGRDLEHFIKPRWENPEDSDIAHFIIHLEDQEDLNPVRRDLKVTLVRGSAHSEINIDHVDFGDRATNFFDATETTFYDNSSIGGVRGHSTEVANIASGNTYGVAKSANILSTKIASGTNNSAHGSDGVRAIKRITSNHNSRSGQSGFRGSAVNYSVDIPVLTNNKASLVQAISAADAQNIIQVAAAGNSNDQAIDHLSAAYAEVITVASITDDYALSGSTSYGRAVDIIAPGTGITTAAADSNDGYYTISGTSFVSPLVAGVCAQFMSYVNAPRTKADLYNMLIDFSIKDQIDVSRGDGNTPNRVVNNAANTAAGQAG